MNTHAKTNAEPLELLRENEASFRGELGDIVLKQNQDLDDFCWRFYGHLEFVTNQLAMHTKELSNVEIEGVEFCTIYSQVLDTLELAKMELDALPCVDTLFMLTKEYFAFEEQYVIPCFQRIQDPTLLNQKPSVNPAPDLDNVRRLPIRKRSREL